jgi:exosortase
MISRTDLKTDRPWQLAVVGVTALMLLAFYNGVFDLFKQWTKADYSHGFLVPPFAAYLLWRRRSMIPATISYPDSWGLPFLAVAAGLSLRELADLNYGKEIARGFAIILGFTGILAMFFGRWKALKWAWPGLVFLLLALPLPFDLEVRLSNRLRLLAAQGGTYVLQTLGFPTYSTGTVIHIGETQLGVAEACSGLSMLLAFVAMCVAIAFLCPPTRSKWDRIGIVASSIPIAVLCNIGRIVVTGLVYHVGWKQLGDFVVHDLAGWLMMPFALGLVWLEFKLIDWILVPVEFASMEEITKVSLTKAAEKIRREEAERAALLEAWKANVGPPPAAGGVP